MMVIMMIEMIMTMKMMTITQKCEKCTAHFIH